MSPQDGCVCGCVCVKEWRNFRKYEAACPGRKGTTWRWRRWHLKPFSFSSKLSTDFQDENRGTDLWSLHVRPPRWMSSTSSFNTPSQRQKARRHLMHNGGENSSGQTVIFILKLVGSLVLLILILNSPKTKDVVLRPRNMRERTRIAHPAHTCSVTPPSHLPGF